MPSTRTPKRLSSAEQTRDLFIRMPSRQLSQPDLQRKPEWTARRPEAPQDHQRRRRSRPVAEAGRPKQSPAERMTTVELRADLARLSRWFPLDPGQPQLRHRRAPSSGTTTAQAGRWLP